APRRRETSCSWLISLQERLFFDLLADRLRRTRRQRGDTFPIFLGETRQPAEEVYQAPARRLSLSRAVAERRHPREPDAMLDDVKELTVGQLLGRGAHVRRPRI